jgi:medium-chain acyl-[acyl-carrier-protein] hydrolase
LPEGLELCPLQLPGREGRWSELAYDRAAPLVEALAAGVAPLLDRPFAVFGHSMGALVGFELVRRLRRQGAAATHLFVAGAAAPQAPWPALPAEAPDDELVAYLRDLGGAPEQALANREMMELVLPTLRADLHLCASNQYRPEPPLACPVTALTGTEEDAGLVAAAEGWREQTAAAFHHHRLPGGHFFLDSQRPHVVRLITAALEGVL